MKVAFAYNALGNVISLDACSISRGVEGARYVEIIHSQCCSQKRGADYNVEDQEVLQVRVQQDM